AISVPKTMPKVTAINNPVPARARDIPAWVKKAVSVVSQRKLARISVSGGSAYCETRPARDENSQAKARMRRGLYFLKTSTEVFASVDRCAISRSFHRSVFRSHLAGD